jgi:hypothetical protein
VRAHSYHARANQGSASIRRSGCAVKSPGSLAAWASARSGTGVTVVGSSWDQRPADDEAHHCSGPRRRGEKEGGSGGGGESLLWDLRARPGGEEPAGSGVGALADAFVRPRDLTRVLRAVGHPNPPDTPAARPSISRMSKEIRGAVGGARGRTPRARSYAVPWSAGSDRGPVLVAVILHRTLVDVSQRRTGSRWQRHRDLGQRRRRCLTRFDAHPHSSDDRTPRSRTQGEH